MDEEQFTVKQASERLKVSKWTIKRLCQNGMIPHVRRNRAGYQIFTAEQVNLMSLLLGLENAGMPRKSLKRLAGLIRQGDATLAEQKAMLETQRRQFWQELEDSQRGIDVIERQIELIDRKMNLR